MAPQPGPVAVVDMSNVPTHSTGLYLFDGTNTLLYAAFLLFFISLVALMSLIHKTFAIFGQLYGLKRRSGKAAYIMCGVTTMDLVQGMVVTLTFLKVVTYTGGLWKNGGDSVLCYVPTSQDLPYVTSVLLVAMWTTMLRYVIGLAMFSPDPASEGQSSLIGRLFFHNAKATLVLAGAHFVTLAVVKHLSWEVGICFQKYKGDPTESLRGTEVYLQAVLPLLAASHLVTWLVKKQPQLLHIFSSKQPHKLSGDVWEWSRVVVGVMVRVAALAWLPWAALSLLNTISSVPLYSMASLTAQMASMAVASLYSIHLCHRYLYRPTTQRPWTVSVI